MSTEKTGFDEKASVPWEIFSSYPVSVIDSAGAMLLYF